MNDLAKERTNTYMRWQPIGHCVYDALVLLFRLSPVFFFLHVLPHFPYFFLLSDSFSSLSASSMYVCLYQKIFFLSNSSTFPGFTPPFAIATSIFFHLTHFVSSSLFLFRVRSTL